MNYLEILTYVFEAFVLSSSIFILLTIKGAFHVRHLYRDNLLLFFISAGVIILYRMLFHVNPVYIIIFIIPGFVFISFVILLIYRFYRNPRRRINARPNEFVAPADGQVIYIKEIEKDQIPVSIKKHRLSKLEELTKTNLLEEPCYLIGIIMTLFDAHINRAPMTGTVILSQHTKGTFLGLKKPESTITNERNTIVIENQAGFKVGVVQIASRFVKRCISTVQKGEMVSQGAPIGKIRLGSQADLIIPRNSTIKVRNGEQVYAGITVIAEFENTL